MTTDKDDPFEPTLEEMEKRLEEDKIIKKFVFGQLTSGLAMRSINTSVREYLEQMLIPIEFNIECLIRDIAIKKTNKLHIKLKDEICQKWLKDKQSNKEGDKK